MRLSDFDWHADDLAEDALAEAEAADEVEYGTRAMTAAVSMLLDEGFCDREASSLALGAVRVGRDPVEFAEYLVRLREAAQA